MLCMELKMDSCHKHPDPELGSLYPDPFVCTITGVRLTVNFSSGADFCEV